MTKEQREELKSGITPLLNTICSMRGLGFDDVEKEFLDFIESEVEKAKKEGEELGRIKERDEIITAFLTGKEDAERRLRVS